MYENNIIAVKEVRLLPGFVQNQGHYVGLLPKEQSKDHEGTRN